jgi:hypothetical protein
MCNLLKTPIGAASPSSPTLLPRLGEGGKNLLKLPPLLVLGEEGWGGEGKYSCTWRNLFKIILIDVKLYKALGILVFINRCTYLRNANKANASFRSRKLIDSTLKTQAIAQLIKVKMWRRNRGEIGEFT